MIVAAGVPPAVEGGILPPGLGVWASRAGDLDACARRARCPALRPARRRPLRAPLDCSGGRPAVEGRHLAARTWRVAVTGWRFGRVCRPGKMPGSTASETPAATDPPLSLTSSSKPYASPP